MIKMPFSYADRLISSKNADEKYLLNEVHHLSVDGFPLLVHYDLRLLKKNWNKADLLTRPNTLWRYHEVLPIKEERNIVSLGEGSTPLVPLSRLGERFSINLLMKDEGIIPTGSFKARGASVGVSKAKELGVRNIVLPTNGNAGAAWALYSARAGIHSYIIMPVDAPKITREEVEISGGNLYLVRGVISDAGKIAAQLISDYGFYDASTLKEPYRIEGKKTMIYEILEQLRWEVPDVILYPTGGGVGIIGIFKGLLELRELGWIKKIPRLVSVQAEGCAPIVGAWEKGQTESRFWDHSKTIAFGINVPKALGDFLVLDALYKTDGYALSVSDREITAAQREVAEFEGSFICPEGAAAFAAMKHLTKKKWIKEGETVVFLNTGLGIKYPESFVPQAPIIDLNEHLQIK